MAAFQALSSIFFLFFFFYLPHTPTCVEICPNSFCKGSDVAVRFPFSFPNSTSRCGFPGFDLHCKNVSQTILNLPKSGRFIVTNIDYEAQVLWINDPDHCMPKRYLYDGFNVEGTPFSIEQSTNFTFLNCSDTSTTLSRYRIPCLSGEHYIVMVTSTTSFFDPITVPPSCSVMKSVLVPVSWPFFTGLGSDVQLTWSEPDCGACEQRGGSCGFKSDHGQDVGCSIPSNDGGLPRSAKYGISLGAGIPGLLCIIGLSCYACSKVWDYNRRRRHSNTEFSTTINPRPVIVMGGLAGSAIEKFPKTQLGESRRLPNPSDNICPICLCEYQPKETLRTIPECNHYFHANCIDEWLRMNATCPLCRNSPDGPSSRSSTTTSTIISPSSSLSSTSTI